MLENATTEGRNPASENLDSLEALEIVRLMNDEDATIAAAVRAEEGSIAKAIEMITESFRRGGRLIYIGAGTSGRLGVLDASECPPTFNTDPKMVVGLVAGGYDALVQSMEDAEDKVGLAENDLRDVDLNEADVLVGIAASGRTPYVIQGLEFARSVGAFAIGLACNADSEMIPAADLMITPVVGPEIVSGSTRMKAGTATKMVLNMLTTGAMVRLGKTYGNLMVDLRATNFKLTERSRRIVKSLTGLADQEAQQLLDECDGEVKTAIVRGKRNCTTIEARQRLAEFDGHLRNALGE